jgi:NADH-quinone oxidoreductase subunit G
MVVGNGGLATGSWDQAIAAAASALRGKKVFVLASPGLSNEALHLLARIVKKQGGAGAYRVERGQEAPLAGVPDLSLRAERAANVRGAELFGFGESDSPLTALTREDVLIVADHAMTPSDITHASRAAAVIVIGTTIVEGLGNVAAILPIANMAEEEGTFTNVRGRVQRFLQAKVAPGEARPSWSVLADLLGAIGESAQYYTAGAVFASAASSHSDFKGLSYDKLGLRGLPVLSAQPAGAA